MAHELAGALQKMRRIGQVSTVKESDIHVSFADDHVVGPFRPARAAGSAPQVYRLGELWACEWISLPTTVYIHRSDDPTVPRITFRRPNFLPPAPHPEVEIDESR